jgi:hypothetical protein
MNRSHRVIRMLTGLAISECGEYRHVFRLGDGTLFVVDSDGA